MNSASLNIKLANCRSFRVCTYFRQSHAISGLARVVDGKTAASAVRYIMCVRTAIRVQGGVVRLDLSGNEQE
jgi:hypothetical protein